MLDRRAFLLSGLAAYSVSARDLFAAASGAAESPGFRHRRLRSAWLRRPGTRRRRPLDAARARPAEWRRHASPADRRCSGRSPTDDRMSRVVRSGRRPRRPTGRTRSTSKWTGWSRTAGTGTSSAPASELSPIGRTRTFPRAQARRRSAPVRVRLVPALRASATTPPTSTWPRKISISWSTWATTSTRTRGRGRIACASTRAASDDARRLPESLRPVPDRSGLQAAHAALPFGRDLGRSRGRQQLRRPASPRPERQWTSSRCAVRAAYQAYYEHMPLRRAIASARRAAAAVPALQFGTSASFLVLDTRQYRTDQPCGDNVSSPVTAVLDPKATLLGAAAGEVADGRRSIASRSRGT